MKKRILLISTSLLLGISLVGCSTNTSTSSSKSSESSSTKEMSVSLTSEKTENTTELSAEIAPISIEEISKAAQLNVDQMLKDNKMFSDTYSNITVTSEGKDTLVYTYTYKEDIPTEAKQSLKDSLEQQSEQLVNGTKAEAERFKTIIPNFKSKYVYNTNDEQLLYEKLITEEDYNK